MICVVNYYRIRSFFLCFLYVSDGVSLSAFLFPSVILCVSQAWMEVEAVLRLAAWPSKYMLVQ